MKNYCTIVQKQFLYIISTGSGSGVLVISDGCE